MRRPLLRDFGGDTFGDLGMEGLAQVPQDFRRRYNDEFIEKIGVRMTIERVGKFAGKPLLGEGLAGAFFLGASADPETRAGSPRTIVALLARGRIVARQNPFDDKV